jgi:cytochrome c-type biogenesis protein CcmH
VKRYFPFLLLFLALLAGALILSQPARAQAPTPSDDQVNAVARQLYCPVCENIPLDVCPTQACAQWREQIRTMLAAGKTPDEIKASFVQQYGDRVLGVPPAKGITQILGYYLPPIAFVAGVLVLVFAFITWRRNAARQESLVKPAEISNDEYVRRLEEELRKQ